MPNRDSPAASLPTADIKALHHAQRQACSIRLEHERLELTQTAQHIGILRDALSMRPCDFGRMASVVHHPACYRPTSLFCSLHSGCTSSTLYTCNLHAQWLRLVKLMSNSKSDCSSTLTLLEDGQPRPCSKKLAAALSDSLHIFWRRSCGMTWLLRQMWKKEMNLCECTF